MKTDWLLWEPVKWRIANLSMTFDGFSRLHLCPFLGKRWFFEWIFQSSWNYNCNNFHTKTKEIILLPWYWNAAFSSVVINWSFSPCHQSWWMMIFKLDTSRHDYLLITSEKRCIIGTLWNRHTVTLIKFLYDLDLILHFAKIS